MDVVLELLASNPGEWAFLLLVACGLGMPPWSEELVLLGTGYFVAQGDIGYLAAVLWCYSGILAGDSVIYVLGRLAGEKVYGLPILKHHLRPARRRRFNQNFLQHGTKAVFTARFLPGLRLVAYLVAGNLRMPYWKFVVLDSIGAILTVPISVWLGWKFAANLDAVLEVLHQFRVPLGILAAIAVAYVWWRLGRSRRVKLLTLKRKRKELHEEKGSDGSAPATEAGNDLEKES